jgi:hypothetical protein
MAAFKKFDPYAFLENRRRLASHPNTIELSQVSRVSRGCHLEIEKTDCQKTAEESPTSNVENEKSTGTPAKAAKAAKSPRIPSTIEDAFAVLERACPSYIEPNRWRLAVADGRLFLDTWGVQAESFGWCSTELFGLHEPPTNPHPSYNRLSRYDCTGLIWLLGSNPVVAMTEDTAAIQHKSGSITVYRKERKPGLGPLGDSLDDFV